MLADIHFVAQALADHRPYRRMLELGRRQSHFEMRWDLRPH
jgi:hypothetical protein